jgi:hypothetical protein
MIRNVLLGEEIVIVAKNKIGILADISKILIDNGINIEAVLGYEEKAVAKILMITNANIRVITELRKKRYKLLKETEVVLVDLENKPGALKLVTTELKNAKIDIKYIYVTSCSCGKSSKMVLKTSDNEKAMSLLVRYVPEGQR